MGKKRSYLLYGEEKHTLPADVHPSEEIDNLLSTFERYGIDIYEDVFSAKAARATTEAVAVTEARPKEDVAAGESVGKVTRPIKEVFKFDEKDLTKEKMDTPTRHTLRIIDKIEKLYDVGLK